MVKIKTFDFENGGPMRCMYLNLILSCLLHHKMFEWYKGNYVIAIDQKEIETYNKNKSRQRVRIDPTLLKWTPKDWSKRHR